METGMTPDTQTITFRNSNPDPILIFRPDGTLWINPIYTTEEAAAKFWEMVHTLNPYPAALAEEEKA